MGWERKRGKLQEFNRLLRGANDTSFVVDADFVPPPDGVRFVLTLDADTILPIGAVAELVGTLVHPLNRPQFDASGRVVKGYGILQPRITPALPTRVGGTPFQQLFSGHAGVDPYTFQVSDINQDLFGEGTFTGKGLYDVDAFEASLAGRTPENAILSHDLFEGSFARCGFVSDVELFEEFPSHTGVADMRSHRWIRGDWQLLPWICGRYWRSVPALARWKMIENLRRSLSAPALFLMLVASWLIPAMAPGTWIGLALVALLLPQVLPLLERLVPQPDLDRSHWLRSLAADFVSRRNARRREPGAARSPRLADGRCDRAHPRAPGEAPQSARVEHQRTGADSGSPVRHELRQKHAARHGDRHRCRCCGVRCPARPVLDGTAVSLHCGCWRR